MNLLDLQISILTYQYFTCLPSLFILHNICRKGLFAATKWNKINSGKNMKKWSLILYVFSVLVVLNDSLTSYWQFALNYWHTILDLYSERAEIWYDREVIKLYTRAYYYLLAI